MAARNKKRRSTQNQTQNHLKQEHQNTGGPDHEDPEPEDRPKSGDRPDEGEQLNLDEVLKLGGTEVS